MKVLVVTVCAWHTLCNLREQIRARTHFYLWRCSKKEKRQGMAQGEKIIGIDLGTTNSVVAVMEG
ncbi:MAG: hypothetical protein VB853_14385, partial [Pirellulales bacterium]